MPEEELFKDSRPYRAAGSIERLLLVTRRFTKYEVTLYALSPVFMSWVLDEHGFMMAWLISDIAGPVRWDRLKLMYTVIAMDRGFSSCTIFRAAMDHRTAGQWRFHVLGKHMHDRLLHRISEFVRPRATNRPLVGFWSRREASTRTQAFYSRVRTSAQPLSHSLLHSRACLQRHVQQQACSSDRARALK